MRQLFKQLFFVSLLSLLLSGCGASLAKNKTDFSGQGVGYTFHLPKTWKESKGFKETYNRQTVYGAEDTKSNSHLFILTYLKKEANREDFAAKNRVELQKRYNYKELSGIYMKEYTINNRPAVKYTLNTKFKEKDVWAHFYYVETEHGFVELIFYSANDGEYKKRSEFIDASVETLVETKAETSTSKVVEQAEDSEAGDTIVVKNEQMTILINGVMSLPDGDARRFLVIRYRFTNNSEEPVIPNKCQAFITATQSKQVLVKGEISKANPELDVKELVKNGTIPIVKGQTVEAALVYELANKEKKVQLDFSKEEFRDSSPQAIVLPE